MRLKHYLGYLWKIPLGSMAFIVGLILAGILTAFLITLLGLQAPESPAGTDAETIGLYLLLGSLLVGLALSWVAQGIRGGFGARWLVIGLLAWVAFAVNSVLEASIFTTTFGPSAGSAWSTGLTLTLPCLAMAAVIVALFPGPGGREGILASLRTFFSKRAPIEWIWRLAASIVAFVAIYVGVGTLVAPYVYDFYAEGAFGLAAPGWGQILPTQFLRSALFLLACLPVLATWQRSNLELTFALGVALFTLVGSMGLIVAYWLPIGLRVIHGAEILIDSLLYALALVILLVVKRSGSGQK